MKGVGGAGWAGSSIRQGHLVSLGGFDWPEGRCPAGGWIALLGGSAHSTSGSQNGR